MSNRSAAQVIPLPPRFIRAMDAPGYLGMCRDEFKKTVRLHVREFPIGKQAIGFDRIELDEWADAYIESMAIEKAANHRMNDSAWKKARIRAAKKWQEMFFAAGTCWLCQHLHSRPEAHL